MLHTAQSVTLCLAQSSSLIFFLPGSFSPAGAGVPEEATAGAGRQVRVGGESVHHRGQLQLLRRGGLSHRGQGAGEWDGATVTCRHRCWKFVSHFLPVQLFLHGLLTSSVTFGGKLTAGGKCFSFPQQHCWRFISQPAGCVQGEGSQDITLHRYVGHRLDISSDCSYRPCILLCRCFFFFFFFFFTFNFSVRWSSMRKKSGFCCHFKRNWLFTARNLSMFTSRGRAWHSEGKFMCLSTFIGARWYKFLSWAWFLPYCVCVCETTLTQVLTWSHGNH